MTRLIIKGLILATFTVPASAGHWIITETETQYIVEYRNSGDGCAAVNTDRINQAGQVTYPSRRTDDEAETAGREATGGITSEPAKTSSMARHE